MRNFQLAIKRLFDIVVSLGMIICLTIIPVLIIIPIAIKLDSRGPVIFKQIRIGKDGKEFEILKFRTMLMPEDRIDKDGNVLEPKQSITRVGNILRKTSLDELSQLFNVLRGDMSIVGPRPMIPKRAKLISEYHFGRHAMRPGVTGLAQVNGRNDLNWDEKVSYDMEYVENYSLWMDIKILFKTVKVVFDRKGIEYINHPENKN